MKITEGLEIKSIVGEKVLIMQGKVGMDMTKVISFNATSEWLWNELRDRTFESEDVARLLTEHFQIDAVTAETDAKAWVAQLVKINAIE